MLAPRDINLCLIVALLAGAACAQFDAEPGYLGLFLNGGGAGGSSSSVPADWWDGDWSRRRLLSVDNTGRGALSDVPVLVQLTSSRVDYTEAAGDGSDVCFVSSDASAGSTPLAHEIEQWNSGGTSILWLKVPSLPAASVASVYMYYGGSTCATTSSDTWNSNYQAVWHLSSSVNDSSGNANALVATGTTDTTGLFANGLSFNGAGDQLEDADGENYINGQSALTFAAWIQAAATGTDRGFFFTGVPAGADDVPGLRFDQAGATGGCANCFKGSVDVGGTNLQFESSSGIQSTTWTHVAMVWRSGSQMEFYVNGTLDTPTANDAATAGTLTGATTVLVGIGAKDNGGTSWDGLMDEVRISNSAASADWVGAQYASMTDAMISYGSEETL